MKIRSFNATDAKALLTLWNRAHPRYPLTEELMAKKIFLDPNFCPSDLLVAEEAGKVIAFAYLPTRRLLVDKNSKPDHSGYIAYFSVDPEHSIEQVGGELLTACEAHHKQQGRVSAGTGYAPLYHLQGFSEISDEAYIDLFRAFGYKEYKSFRRRATLSNYQPPANYEEHRQALEQEGFYIGALPYEYLAEFVDSDNTFSNSDWAWEFRVRLANELDLARARVAVWQGKLIGGCIFGDTNSDAGRFGPFGVCSDYRGKGIGSVLFADCILEMKRRGIDSAWAQWTPLGGTAGALYDKAGFLMEDCFLTFTKELK